MKEKDVFIEELSLSKDSYGYLKRNGIETVESLLHLPVSALAGSANTELYLVAEIMYKVGKYISDKLETESQSTQNPTECFPDTFVSELPESAAAEFKKKNVLHVIDEETMEKELAEVLFINDEGMLVDDIEVENMNLSARSVGALLRNNLCTAKKIIFSEYKDFEELKGFGKNSIEEVLYKLKQMTYILYKSDKNNALIEASISSIMMDIKEHCPMLKTAQYESLIKAAVYKNENILKNDNSKITDDRELMNRIYSEPSVYRVFSEYLLSLLQNNGIISLNILKQQMPEGICNSNILLQIIDCLSKDGKIDCTDDGLCIHLLTLDEYMKMLKADNSKQALIYRLRGMTLEEAGNEMGITRERTRQLTKKVLEKIPFLKEDELRHWFENYDITAAEFQAIFNLSEEGYRYLSLKYSKGNKILEELLDDNLITGKIAQKVLVEMRKYCVMINGEYIPIRRDLLLRKLIEVNYSDKECTFSEFADLYKNFLIEHKLDKDDKLLFPTERAFESRLVDNKYILLKYGHRLRYYDMEAYDIQALFDELEFKMYEGLEISTLKLFKTHQELMNEYGIWDEYELHNLMKKNEEKLEPYGVSLGRMPLILIGNTDRGRQTIQFLYRVAPIGLYEFGNAYEAEFGIRSETVLANFIQYVDKYYHNGVFSIDYEIMTNEEYHMLEGKLKNEIYFIEDVKKLYIEIFPNGSPEKINPYTLKTMGFKVFSDYILKNSYPSSEAYFKEFLQKSEIIDMDSLDRRLTQNQTFQMVLEELRVNFDLLEIEKNRYISFFAFSTKVPEIMKNDLEKFVVEASNYNQADFFTIQSIRKEGFISNIDYLDFTDWFYGALLRSCKNISYSKVAGGFLFSHRNKLFKRSDFFLFVMERLIKTSITEFIRYIINTYGLHFDRYDVPAIINQSGMYYHSETETIYLNKEIYYGEL